MTARVCSLHGDGSTIVEYVVSLHHRCSQWSSAHTFDRRPSLLFPVRIKHHQGLPVRSRWYDPSV